MKCCGFVQVVDSSNRTKASPPCDAGEGILVLHRPSGAELVPRPGRRRQVAADRALEDGLRRTGLRGIDRHARRKPSARLHDAPRLAQRPEEVRDELKAVAANARIEMGVGKAKLFHIHQLEPNR
jgi:hypothetical protein